MTTAKIKIKLEKEQLKAVYNHMNNCFANFNKQYLDVATFYNILGIAKKIQRQMLNDSKSNILSLTIDEYKALHKISITNLDIKNAFEYTNYSSVLNESRIQIERYENLMKSSLVI